MLSEKHLSMYLRSLLHGAVTQKIGLLQLYVNEYTPKIIHSQLKRMLNLCSLRAGLLWPEAD